jgi:hypothetical protein
VLFAYPKIEANANWLHECLEEMVVKVHEAIRAGEEPPLWPQVIPPRHRPAIHSRRSLRDRIASYAEAARLLSLSEHERVMTALSGQNEIEALLADNTECERLRDLPEAICDPLCDLFHAAFRLLADLDVRDRHEERLIAAHGLAMCPFCGCEYFEPSGVRADLDHFLARTVYPYASANLENLVPMGKHCNQDFKGQLDILFDGKRRRTAYFPFGVDVAAVDLDGSDPLGDGRRPSWVVRLVPEDERTETWDCVFRIKERYARILRHGYGGFLHEFSAQCSFRTQPPSGKVELSEALESFVELQEGYGLNDRAFLKAAVFRMLLKHCREGNDDLIELLLAVAREAAAP